MGPMEDLAKRGGLWGIARQKFETELDKAFEDSSHFLRPVVEAASRGTKVKGVRLLWFILLEAAQNKGHPLHEFAFLYVTLPALGRELNAAFSLVDSRGLGRLLEKVTVEEAVNLGEDFRDADKHRKSKKGASEGGKKKAGVSTNGSRDIAIRLSTESVSELARLYGLDPRRIRQIKEGKGGTLPQR